MIRKDHAGLRLIKKYKLLKMSRSSLYYTLSGHIPRLINERLTPHSLTRYRLTKRHET
jgi:hypothetical protein